MARSYTGATCNSRENLQLDAGAFFRDFDLTTDLDRLADPETYAELVATKGLGATQGGGNFTATPVTRQIELDGLDPITVIDSWTVTMLANLIEASPSSFSIALGTGVVNDAPDGLAGKYKLIQAKRQVSSDDYIDNITWIGSIMGFADPVIIQIFNAISTSGINVNMAPKSNMLIPVTFSSATDLCAHPELADYAPFAIYYPTTKADDGADTGTDTDSGGDGEVTP